MDNGLFERYYRLRFLAKVCLVTVAGVFAFTLAVYLYTSRGLGSGYAEAIYTIYDLRIRIFPLIFSSFYSIFILAVVTAAVGAITVLFSHRVAGPVYRLARNLEAIGDGDFTVNTRLRGDDQLKALAVEMNAMTRSLNHLSRSCADALADVVRSSEKLAALLAGDRPDETEVRRAAEELKRGIDELKRLTSPLRLSE
ncbi:MAG: HAMP domain-containing protein [Thermodesulfobacteriota bacterium]